MSGMTTGNASTYEPLSSVYWGDHLVLLDQRLLRKGVYLQLFTGGSLGRHSLHESPRRAGYRHRGDSAQSLAACRLKPTITRDGQQVAKPALISQRQTDSRQSVLGAGPHQACG